ncbi:MAG: YbaB/EbfC family nucleoid-associated protein [Alphaproteobacteria bacterium]|nr:YbaB/EbfC family nucleoid-associated protein [Alphaproteobacteria bacterium]
MLNFQKMMQQAQQMQFKLQEMQEKLADIEVEGQAGGGLVKVRMTCKGDVTALEIDPSIMGDKETLEDLVIAAVNNANEAKETKIKDETAQMMQSMGLPPGAQLPF